jgi:putative two-component system response regulator
MCTPCNVRYVLIAEDDPAIAELLCLALSDQLEVATEIVPNGALVMDSLTARRPDLLILDIEMPGLNGLDVFDLVRNDLHWQGVPILFLTAAPEKALTARAPTGAHEILSKPFDIDDLVARAERMMAGKKADVAA